MVRVDASMQRIMHVYLVAFMLILVFLVCTWQVRLRVEGGPRGTSRPHKWFQQPNISLGRTRMLVSGPVVLYKRGKSENFACFVRVRAIAVYTYTNLNYVNRFSFLIDNFTLTSTLIRGREKNRILGLHT